MGRGDNKWLSTEACTLLKGDRIEMFICGTWSGGLQGLLISIRDREPKVLERIQIKVDSERLRAAWVVSSPHQNTKALLDTLDAVVSNGKRNKH